MTLKRHSRSTRAALPVCIGILQRGIRAVGMDYCNGLVVLACGGLVLFVFGRRRRELWSVLNDVVVLADDADAVPDLDFRHFDDV